MKTLINMSTDQDDMNRYADRPEFLEALDGLDGVELSYYGSDERNIIPKELVIGYHMTIPNCWYDFYVGDRDALIKEFDTEENWINYYKGHDKSALVQRIKDELDNALDYGAEYLVFHVSECNFRESLSFDFHRTDEEIVDAVADLINEVFTDKDTNVQLLFENLWVPGMTFTKPQITKRLLDSIDYENKGIILDTGHLMHTNTSIRTPEEAIPYINEMLSIHGDLCSYIKAVHLNQSISGEYIESMKNKNHIYKTTFEDRHWDTFVHIFKMDKHEPFTSEGVRELIQRISPEYLTMEFITSDLAMQNRYKNEQLKCLRD